jgi:hypothetical protein
MRPLANVLAALVVIYTSGCGSPAGDSTPPDLFPAEPPIADMAIDAAPPPPDLLPPPPDLLPPPPDLTPPPPVDAPIEPPHFLGVTGPGSLVVGAGFVEETRTLQPVCYTTPSFFVPRAQGRTGTPDINLSAFDVARMLEIGSGAKYEDATLYDSLPAVPAFIDEAGVARTTDLNYLMPVLAVNAGNWVFDDNDFTKIGDCGDHIVHQVIMGARLVVGLKLRFVDEASLRSFENLYGSQLNVILQRNDLGWVSVALDHKATITVQAAQVGGDPSKLKAILDASRCSIGNLPACNETITNVIAYSTVFSQDLGPIPQQGSTEFGGFVPLVGLLIPSSYLP